MAEPKPKATDSLRTPGPKKKLGLSVPPALRLPHEDLIHPETPTESMPSQTSQASTTTHTGQTSHTASQDMPPVAPQRDYSKVANSINRQALPSGVFKGKSKQLYDCLYSLTRGAVVPSRTVRISRPKLMKKAHIGARVTFDSNISHLLNVGLIMIRQIVGEHEGNEYEVFLPEEVDVSIPSQASLTSQTRYAQKVDRLVRLETSQTRHSLSPLVAAISEESKTSFKTNTERSDDDEAGAAVARALNKLIEEITGREATRGEYGKLVELVEVLTLEGKIAAARTTVSSAGPFLAEHLRRRLFKKDKQQLAAETAQSEPTVPIDAGKCPDCGGAGWYYPESKEKGIAKCKHTRL